MKFSLSARQGLGGTASPPAKTESRAFTRLELAVLLAALGLLTLLVLPALANNRERSLRILCVNNLRLLGQGYAQWGAEHSGRTPVRTPWWEGGINVYFTPSPVGSLTPVWLSAGLQNNAWFQFAWMSNELCSPRILACPSDTGKVPATGWGSNPDGGIVHPNYQDRSVSYFVNLDYVAWLSVGTISGDRNLRYQSIAGSCSSGLAPVLEIDYLRSTNLGIQGGLHVEQGNYLLSDGRVEEWSSQAFADRFPKLANDDNGTFHYIVP